MNVQALRACEQKDLNGTGFQPFRSNGEHVLACLGCRGHIPLGTHRESTVNLLSIPADTSFQRRAAPQPTMKVAEPIEQRSSVSQQHFDDLRILHRKRFGIKPEFATSDHQNAGVDSEGLLVMESLLSSDG
jgi:hypothetical protein